MEKNKLFYVYILECADTSLYTGYTVDIRKRVALHNKGKGAKYTRGRRPVKLVYSTSFPTKSQAMQAEYWIKQLSAQEKRLLIQGKFPLKKIIPSDL
ncbi:MAG: GIY-YIG nuclease family protein [Tissierellia bacterium]|nr:GIY-YIG nuclease family protein [Tissierellia bacterium]